MDALEAPNDHTLVFRMKRPFPLLPVALGKVGVSTAVIMPERLARTSPTTQVTEMVGSGLFHFRADQRLPGSLAVYERFEGYVPRSSGTTSLLAGPKIVHLNRVEWHTIPDTSTASAALRSGEMDWWEAADAENVPVLRRRQDIVVRVQDCPGYAAALRPNCLQPPFNNPAIRRALMGAISQHDMMVTAAGDDPALWRDRLGYFHPRSSMATDAGMELLTGPRNLKRVDATW
jgi:peptide/nickel transport system substrate-binding protein